MAAATPTKLQFVTLDVFTDTRYLGNPLAVVLVGASQRDALTQEKKQRIAQEYNLSETVFLHVPAASEEPADTVEIDIFCVDCELPFAGHPTIGSAYLVLHHLGWKHVTTLLTKAGPISISSDGDTVRAGIPHAVHVHRNSPGDLAAETAGSYEPYLNEKPSIREAERAGQVVSIVRGMTFVMVRLDGGLEDLALVTDSRRGLDFGKVDGLLDEGEWSGGFTARYYYVLETPEPVRRTDGGKLEVRVRTRMAELATEDPATGSASSALACKLALEWKLTEPFVMRNTQGVEMGRRSEIEVEVVPGVGPDGVLEIREVYLAGQATVVMDGSILL